ncbi:MAG: C25 family cysteine peptidase, partial [bacterium]
MTPAENTINGLKSPENAADYLAICPGALCDGVRPLIKLRKEQGLRVRAARVEDIEKEFPAENRAESIRQFLRYAWANWRPPAPRYVLFVGDAVGIKGEDWSLLIPHMSLVTEQRAYVRDEKELIGTDNFYALMDGDDIPDFAIGRLPADNREELDAMVAKIVEYETANAFGTWRRKASFFASEGHFGSVDQLLEKLAKNMFKHNVLPLFDISMTYANPGMEYFYPADEFGGKVLERFRENPLFMIYIGHGDVMGFDDVRFEGRRYPIMGVDDVAKLNGGGGRYPIVFIMACNTGYFDSPEHDSIGEELVKNPKGPVGVFASSRVSDPYGNGVLAKEIANVLLYNLEPRIGDALIKAKRASVENYDKDRKYIDKVATLFIPIDEMPVSIREHLYLYNYLGDPATMVQFPMNRMDVQAPKEAAPGSKISVMGRLMGMSAGK